MTRRGLIGSAFAGFQGYQEIVETLWCAYRTLRACIGSYNEARRAEGWCPLATDILDIWFRVLQAWRKSNPELEALHSGWCACRERLAVPRAAASTLPFAATVAE